MGTSSAPPPLKEEGRSGDVNHPPRTGGVEWGRHPPSQLKEKEQSGEVNHPPRTGGVEWGRHPPPAY